AANCGHLAEQKAYTSGSGLDEAPVTGLDGIGVMREGVGDESLVHSGRGNLEIHLVGNANQARRRKHGMRSVGISPEADAIADVEIRDSRAQRLHDADSLAAQKCREFAAVGLDSGRCLRSSRARLAVV